MDVPIKRVNPNVELPKYESKGAVGFDLVAAEAVTIPAKELALIPTGLAVATPPGYMLILASRSSSPKRHGLLMPHGIGIIDPDYSGDDDELLVQVYNFRDEPVTIEQGTRIAQGVFARVDRAEWQEQEQMGDSRGGFGSTG